MGKAFNAEIPLKQRNEWGGFLREESEKIRRLTAKIKQAEHEVDAIIDKLFDLTLARSRFSKVRLPGNIDCHVNGWRLSFLKTPAPSAWAPGHPNHHATMPGSIPGPDPGPVMTPFLQRYRGDAGNRLQN
jgi:hypothetical protein